MSNLVSNIIFIIITPSFKFSDSDLSFLAKTGEDPFPIKNTFIGGELKEASYGNIIECYN